MNEGASGKAGGLIEFLDFGFTKFVTLKAIKVVYALGLILFLLAWVVMIIGAIATGRIVPMLGAVVIGAIAVPVYAILLRIQLELIAVIFRIGENTTKLVQIGEMRG